MGRLEPAPVFSIVSALDLTFDCRLDAGGRDPDSHSPTLRRYHQHFWSKELPSGEFFGLDISGPKPFLVHRSRLGEFSLTSDSITHRYTKCPSLMTLVPLLPAGQRAFAEGKEWLISECILFPGRRVGGMNTINGARGMSAKIGDRFDLTLECIRRHYSGETSPLADTLERHADFFALFESFRGYVEFFLLQDLVDDQAAAVKFYLPFDEFRGSPFPSDLGSYEFYLANVESFAKARAKRMLLWCQGDNQAF